jgi:hypothetical protein
MADEIRPLARLFRRMADLIDRDHTNRTRYEAIANAAGVVAAHATAQELVDGRLWWVDGAELLAAAYAFHAGLPRQAATAAHVQAMHESDPGRAGGRRQSPMVAPPRSGWPDIGNPEAWTAPPSSPVGSITAPLGPHRLPGPHLGELDPADVAKVWALVLELRGGQVIPRGQLIRLTGLIPADLAARLLRLLDGGPELAVERGRPPRPGTLAPRLDSNGWATVDHGIVAAWPLYPA